MLNNNDQYQATINTQHQVFLGIADELASIKDIQNQILQEIRFQRDYGQPSSPTTRYIYNYLNDLNWRQISMLFEELIIRFNRENRESQIPPITRDEKRKKSLLLHKLDIYWDQLQPFLNDGTIPDIRNTLPVPVNQ